MEPEATFLYVVSWPEPSAYQHEGNDTLPHNEGCYVVMVCKSLRTIKSAASHFAVEADIPTSMCVACSYH